MIEVRVERSSASEIMEIVKELRSSGMVQGQDFDFSFRPEQYNNDGFEKVRERHTVFYFYKEKYATFFTLKYL